MKRLALVLPALAALACSQPATPAAQKAQAEMRTINDVPPRPAKLVPPPMLTDEAPPPKPKALPWETPTPIVFSPEDEALRASLPFTPAIAMDPVNGNKISIRAATPTFEYKGKIYYFEDEANKRAFTANPPAYLTGKFTKL
jgi:YHS domain-containing protein